MKKKIICIFMMLMLITMIFPSSATSISKIVNHKNLFEMNNNQDNDEQISSLNTITVDDDGGADFRKIQDAIDASFPGDTIYVYSGRYEENLEVDKSIILTGEDKETTIINSSIYNNIVNISADNVKMSGFTVEKSGGYDFDSGIDIQANNTEIFDNILDNKEIYYYSNGIYITSNRNSNVIRDNYFVNSGLGLSTVNTEDNVIIDNIVNGKSLVYLDSLSDQIIESAGQIILKDCENITIRDLEIQHTSTSILLINSDNCFITGCTLKSNDEAIKGARLTSLEIVDNHIYSNNEGVVLTSVEDSKIFQNDIHSNTEALWIEYSMRINITRNNLYSNGFCLYIIFSDLNIIKQNNFGNNLRNIFSIMGSLNSYYNNYWDRPRIFPKIIFEFPRINFDWYPANTPFNI